MAKLTLHEVTLTQALRKTRSGEPLVERYEHYLRKQSTGELLAIRELRRWGANYAVVTADDRFLVIDPKRKLLASRKRRCV